ncbi:MAG: hypothetical protein WBX15_15105 [Thermoanaerobaculia bacterium]
MLGRRELRRLPDRRRRRRIVTLKNFGWLLLVVTVGFAALSLFEEFRGPADHRSGRLWNQRVAATTTVPSHPPEVIVTEEAPQAIPETSTVDPLSLDAARREQILGATPEDLQPDSEPAGFASSGEPMISGAPQPDRNSRFVIRGGPEGVRLDRKTSTVQ